MKLLGVDHIDIVVKDLKSSIEFYKTFGMSPEGSLDNGQTVFMWNGDHENPVRIELDQAVDGAEPGIDHLSFRVEDPLDSTKEAQFQGVDFLFEPFENHQSGRTISNCYDPDGVQIQICKQTSPGTYKNWE